MECIDARLSYWTDQTPVIPLTDPSYLRINTDHGSGWIAAPVHTKPPNPDSAPKYLHQRMLGHPSGKKHISPDLEPPEEFVFDWKNWSQQVLHLPVRWDDFYRHQLTW
jgi:hypothetical protein